MTETSEGPLQLHLQFFERSRSLRATWHTPVKSATVKEVVNCLLDLDSDLAAFHRVAAAEPLLAGMVRRHPGIRLLGFVDPFEGLVRAIVGQQVSVAGARTVLGRMVERWGRRHNPLKAEVSKSFPSPTALARLTVDDLCPVGLTRRRAETVMGCARAVAEGRLNFQDLRKMPAGEADAALQRLRGIGPWTAAYVRMRSLRDRDAFPARDLGVIKALERWAPKADPVALSERWRPWRAYATLHLWNSLGTE